MLLPQDVRDSLQLLEVWRADKAGGRLVRAGVEGSVRLKLAPYGLNRARFRLRPARSALINACLRVALMNGQYAERLQGAGGQLEGFAAAIARAPVGCSYLKYRCGTPLAAPWPGCMRQPCCMRWRSSRHRAQGHACQGRPSSRGERQTAALRARPTCCRLPAVACAPPLQLALHILPGADTAPRSGGAPPQLLLVLRYAANPQMLGALLDVTVDLDLPPQLSALIKVGGQWGW